MNKKLLTLCLTIPISTCLLSQDKIVDNKIKNKTQKRITDEQIKDLNKTIVVVDNTPITQYMFNKAMYEFVNKNKDKINLNDNNQEMIQSFVLNNLIMQTLLYNEAKKEGIDKSKEFKLSFESEKNEIERKILMLLYKEKMKKSIKITEKEMKEFYEKNKELFKSPKQIHAYHIVLSNEKKAKEFYEELSKLKGKEQEKRFQEIAKKYSIGPSGIKGGDLGYFSKKDMTEDFSVPVFTSKTKGLYNGVIKTIFGYHIVYIKDIKPERVKKYDEVKNQIKKIILNEKYNNILNKKLEELRKKSDIKLKEMP